MDLQLLEKKEFNEISKRFFQMLDEGIEDMENGRVETIEEAWKEIDRI
ncbi:MAG: hypothetical protein IJA34_06050 [Lachnospiraceae bacterium]|nr:hypothetical protein [Lachnospiraceae bacterium]